jgi:hypothetical protein
MNACCYSEFDPRERGEQGLAGYELATKKRNQVAIEQQQREEPGRAGYEVVTPSVTAVTLFFR